MIDKPHRIQVQMTYDPLRDLFCMMHGPAPIVTRDQRTYWTDGYPNDPSTRAEIEAEMEAIYEPHGGNPVTLMFSFDSAEALADYVHKRTSCKQDSVTNPLVGMMTQVLSDPKASEAIGKLLSAQIGR